MSQTQRRMMLRRAGACVRGNGLPSYADPVISSDGLVYTDQRNFREAGIGDIDDPRWMRIMKACGGLIAGAGFFPYDEATAPAALVSAGVRAARCLRGHGLPAYRDPTATSPFTPGHGFGIAGWELPWGTGKSDPTVQHALAACRGTLDAEIAASELTALADE